MHSCKTTWFLVLWESEQNEQAKSERRSSRATTHNAKRTAPKKDGKSAIGDAKFRPLQDMICRRATVESTSGSTLDSGTPPQRFLASSTTETSHPLTFHLTPLCSSRVVASMFSQTIAEDNFIRQIYKK